MKARALSPWRSVGVSSRRSVPRSRCVVGWRSPCRAEIRSRETGRPPLRMPCDERAALAAGVRRGVWVVTGQGGIVERASLPRRVEVECQPRGCARVESAEA